MSKVFATQVPYGLNRNTGKLEPKVSLEPSDPLGRAVRERYGEITWVCDPNDAPWKAGVMDKMRRTMDEYEEGDWLLLLGNPVLMCMMALYAGDHVTHLRFLQYTNPDRASGGQGDYRPLVIEIDPDYVTDIIGSPPN